MTVFFFDSCVCPAVCVYPVPGLPASALPVWPLGTHHQGPHDGSGQVPLHPAAVQCRVYVAGCQAYGPKYYCTVRS